MAFLRGTVGKTTITGKRQITLPADGFRRLGWETGDELIVEIADEDRMVLRRRPTSYADYYAGKLGHVFGNHDDNLRYLDEERAGWDEAR